jgi:hypothetical protein
MKVDKKGTDLDSLAARRELDILIAHLQSVAHSFRARGDPGSVHLTRAIESTERLRIYIESQSSKKNDWTTIVQTIALVIDLLIKFWE